MSEEKIRLFERRCTNCNALLFKAVIEVGKVECKCGKCGVTNKIEADSTEKIACRPPYYIEKYEGGKLLGVEVHDYYK